MRPTKTSKATFMIDPSAVLEFLQSLIILSPNPEISTRVTGIRGFRVNSVVNVSCSLSSTNFVVPVLVALYAVSDVIFPGMDGELLYTRRG